MRRILLITLAVFVFAGVVGGAGSYVVAERGPFVPGDLLFPAQWWSEQMWSLALNDDSVERAAILLNILGINTTPSLKLVC